MNDSDFLDRQALQARAGMREAVRGLVEDVAEPLELQRHVRKRPFVSLAVAAVAGFALTLLTPRRARTRTAEPRNGPLARAANRVSRLLRTGFETMLMASMAPRSSPPPTAEHDSERS